MAEIRETMVCIVCIATPMIETCQAFSRIPNDRRLNLQANGCIRGLLGNHVARRSAVFHVPHKKLREINENRSNIYRTSVAN